MIAHSQDIEPTLRELIEWQAKINEGYARIENVVNRIARFDCFGKQAGKTLTLYSLAFKLVCMHRLFSFKVCTYRLF